MYRAFSWLERVEHLDSTEGVLSIDDQLILSWTALNSLYGQWNPDRGEPEPDIQSLERFGDHLLAIDREGRLPEFVEEQRPLVLEIFDSPFLARSFWTDPTPGKIDRKTKLRYKAPGWYNEKAYGLLLEKILRSVYYQRCLLIHGAATRESSLNRDTVGVCLRLLRGFLPVALQVIIDRGAREDWGVGCYPVVV